jgi:hypothetical protein
MQQCWIIHIYQLISNYFICVESRICWPRIYAKNGKTMHALCCGYCMLSSVMAGIILWLVMSPDFSLIHHDVGCGFCREMMWSQNRDKKSRANSLYSRLYEIRLGSMLSTDFQMIPKWTARNLWQIYLPRSKKRSFLKEGRLIQNNLWFISKIAQFTRVGPQQSGSNNMACAACHGNHIRIILPSVTSTYFLQWKKNSNGLRSLTKTSFLNPYKRFWWVWISKNWIGYFRLGYNEFKKQVKVMEATSDDKQVLSIKVLRIFIRPDWGMYLLTRR